MVRMLLKAVFAVIAVSSALLAWSQPAEDDFVQRRKEAARKSRRLILNNDGCDVLYFPAKQEVNTENFLALRTSPLADTQVDTVFYCSISSGFSNFTHDTKVGTVLNREIGLLKDKINATQPMIDQGADCLKAVVDFCHANGMDAFWSMRMNDTHDQAYTPENDYPLYPPLKLEHPEWLVGSRDKRPPKGTWSSVDYTLPQIRDLAYRYIEEVCQNYDVDGVEMDYFRHLCYLKSVAWGEVASDEEIEMMTDLMRRVREMADREGRRRGRPIVLAIRVPDSVEYCKALGFDLEAWLSEDLVDIVIGGGYFQLNKWEYLVELGHRYGAMVYPGLSESRVRGEGTRFKRQSAESYRGRALRAWQAGVDGIYLFNYFNPRGGFLRELGDPELLRTLDHIYFASIRNGDPGRYLTDGRDYTNVPILTPSDPLAIKPGRSEIVEVGIGDDFSKIAQAKMPAVKCHVLALGGERLALKVNGQAAGPCEQADAWWDYALDPAVLKPGMNDFELIGNAEQTVEGTGPAWNVTWTAEAKPGAPWAGDRPKEGVFSELQDDAMLIADRGENSGDYFYYAYAWNADPAQDTVVEARVKVGDGWNNIIVENGVCAERITLYPDYVGTYSSHLRYDMDTTDDFHTYRVVMRGEDILVYVDGVLRLDGTGKYTASSGGRNFIRFGAANSGSTGEAYWQQVRFRTPAITVYDLVVSVTQPKDQQ